MEQWTEYHCCIHANLRVCQPESCHSGVQWSSCRLSLSLTHTRHHLLRSVHGRPGLFAICLFFHWDLGLLLGKGSCALPFLELLTGFKWTTAAEHYETHFVGFEPTFPQLCMSKYRTGLSPKNYLFTLLDNLLANLLSCEGEICCVSARTSK